MRRGRVVGSFSRVELQSHSENIIVGKFIIPCAIIVGKIRLPFTVGKVIGDLHKSVEQAKISIYSGLDFIPSRAYNQTCSTSMAHRSTNPRFFHSPAKAQYVPVTDREIIGDLIKPIRIVSQIVSDSVLKKTIPPQRFVVSTYRFSKHFARIPDG